MGRESAADKFAQTERLNEGIRGIVDAWETDIFREKAAWEKRGQQRAALATSIVAWMNEEVVDTGGVIGEDETYEDNLSVEVMETMADDDLTDALERFSNEEDEILKLVRNSLDFTNRLLNPPDGQTQDQVLEASRKQSEADVQAGFAPEPWRDE